VTTVPVVRFTIAGKDRDAPLTPPSEPRPFTVVYDGACRVCQRLVKLLTKWDRHHQIEIVPSQAPGVRARFPWIPDRAYAESVQLIGPGGRTWQGAAALEHILDALPKGKLISWVFSIPFVRPLAERFYRWFARNRYRLGCGEHCQYRELRLDYHDEEVAESREPALTS
jgi:predicted DCC family thiol-disulfide oxidoreductase YuxK